MAFLCWIAHDAGRAGCALVLDRARRRSGWLCARAWIAHDAGRAGCALVLDRARHPPGAAFVIDCNGFDPGIASEIMDTLSGKVVVITGASEGIGAQLAVLLQTSGARLALAARNEAKLAAIARPDDLVVAGDITTDEARQNLIAKTTARWGRIDVLINNAGRGSWYTASTVPMEEARAVFELNFFAPLALALLATHWLRQSRGTLVNVSSIAGQISLPWLPVYSASKFALSAITSAQRNELRRDGVHVMGVYPGYVDTDFQSHAAGPPPPGRVVAGKKFAVSARQCAQAIVDGIAHRRQTVVTPQAGWILVWANRFFPSFIESRMERV